MVSKNQHKYRYVHLQTSCFNSNYLIILQQLQPFSIKRTCVLKIFDTSCWIPPRNLWFLWMFDWIADIAAGFSVERFDGMIDISSIGIQGDPCFKNVNFGRDVPLGCSS